MNNEITSNEIVENVEETVKRNGLKKGAIAIGITGAIAGLGYAIFKFGKKLANKVKAKKEEKFKKMEKEVDEFMTKFDDNSAENKESETK